MIETANDFLTLWNRLADGYWRFASVMFVQSAVLIAVLFAVTFLLRHRARAVVRYGLWMLLLVKLVTPVTLRSPTSPAYWVAPVAAPLLSVAHEAPLHPNQVARTLVVEPVPIGESPLRPLGPELIPSTATPARPDGASPTFDWHRITWQALVFTAWLAGVAILAVVLVRRAWSVRLLVHRAEPAGEDLAAQLNACCEDVGVRADRLGLKVAADMTGPAVCGLFRPTILLPAALVERLNAEQLRAVFIHELAHVKRGDLIVNLIQTLLQIAYFYNPLLWLANAEIRRLREQAVDEMTLVALGQDAPRYSRHLVDIAEMTAFRAPLTLPMVSILESKKALRQRIRHIVSRPTPKSARVGFTGFSSLLLAATILIPMASAQQDKETKPAAQAKKGTPQPDVPALKHPQTQTGNQAKPPAVTYHGDMELVNMVAKAHQSNLERIATWSGSAEVLAQNFISEDEHAGWTLDTLKAGKVSYVWDQSSDSRRSNWVDTKLKFSDEEFRKAAQEGKSVQGNDDLLDYNFMLRQDGYFQYFGSPKRKGQHTLVIYPRSKALHPWAEDFSPILYMNSTTRRDPEISWEQYLESLFSNSTEPPRPVDKSGRRAVITVYRNGDMVSLVHKILSNLATRTWRYEFNLAQGGNIVSHAFSGPAYLEDYRFSYQESGGVWIPRSFSQKRVQESGKSKTKRTQLVKFLERQVINEPIDVSEFALEEIGVKPGNSVTDHRNRPGYLTYTFTRETFPSTRELQQK